MTQLKQKVEKILKQDNASSSEAPVIEKCKEYDFLSLQSPEFQELYYMFLDLKAAELSTEEIKKSLAIRFENQWEIPSAAAEKLSVDIYAKFSEQDFMTRFLDEKSLPSTDESDDKSRDSKAFLTLLDYERFVQYTSLDPDASTDVKAVLLALIVNYRRNYHKSGWIKYDRKNILYLANLIGRPADAQDRIFRHLYTEYGLEMRVVGSNNPTPCYKIAWLFDQPQPGSHFNPFIEFGALIPKSIHAVASGEIKLDVSAKRKGE